MKADPFITNIKNITHRLIASRWPTVGVFDTVASAGDAKISMLVETLTNPRLNPAIEILNKIPNEEIVTGANASIIMAAFIHVNPSGGRFNTSDMGAWYCSFDLRTAIEETIYTHTKKLQKSEMGYKAKIQMREYVANIDIDVHDVRNRGNEQQGIYDKNLYNESQEFAKHLKKQKSNGICYNSVRHNGGTNLVIFRPKLVPQIVQGEHLQYEWNGSERPSVLKLTNL